MPVRHVWAEDAHTDDPPFPPDVVVGIRAARALFEQTEEVLQQLQLWCTKNGYPIAQQDLEAIRQDAKDCADDLQQVLVEHGAEELP